MNKTYGYCRISTNKQNIERQVRNITAAYPDATIIKETYTGTQFQGRKELDKMLKQIRSGDTIIFDSVSRMSRNAEEGFALYEELFHRGIHLIFLREPHINTETYRKALTVNIPMTGTNVDILLKAVQEYMMVLAKDQIQIAFDQSEKEVADLRERTKGGIETARRNGKQIGRNPGSVSETKKAIEAKKIILKHNKSFGGSLSDIDTITLTGITRKTFYKYKKELRQQDEVN